MTWKDRLQKIKTEAKASRERRKEEAIELSGRVNELIEEVEDLAKQFSSVSKAKVRLFNQRHKQIDEITGKKYYTGGIILEIYKPKSSLSGWLKSEEPEERLILQVEFPHPEAIRRLEGYEDRVKIFGSRTEKEIPLKEFSPDIFKIQLEEAYSYYLSKLK